MKSYQISWTYEGPDTKSNAQMRSASAQEGIRLLDFCRAHRIGLEAACGGLGICGKCAVQIICGEAPVTADDMRVFTGAQLEEGLRLACRVRVMGPLAFRIVQAGDMAVQSPDSGCVDRPVLSTQREQEDQDGQEELKQTESIHALTETVCQSPPCGVVCDIALDLGSTTLAAVLLESADQPLSSADNANRPAGAAQDHAGISDHAGRILARAAAVNSQRQYGADVISRIQASNAGDGEALRECICRDLEALFLQLVDQFHSAEAARDNQSGQLRRVIRINRIAIAGNTVMLHLLRGYSCEGLGRAPFTPVNLSLEELDYAEVFGRAADARMLCDAKVCLLPGLSAYVGADITAGLYSSGFLREPESSLAVFLDLGTNGEMAVGNGVGFVYASTAAGPAFEGGGLSCGMPGVPGAICRVSYQYHRVRVQTIGQKKPLGLCGTGALEAVAALLGEGLLSAEGLLVPKLFSEGLALGQRADGSRILLTQADIRMIQLAKAAVRAGLETLTSRYLQIYRGFDPGQTALTCVDRVYLAGGFGYYLPVDTAIAVGLFPQEWRGRVTVCGNTSLTGACAYLADSACGGQLGMLGSIGTEIQLAEDPLFQESYLCDMDFP